MHRVSVRLRQEIYGSEIRNGRRLKVFEKDYEFADSFEVVADSQAAQIRIITDKSTRDEIAAGFKLENFRVRSALQTGCYLTGQISISNTPVAIACDALAEFDSVDHAHLGPVKALAAGGIFQTSVFAEVPCDCPRRLDIVLRCTADAARETVDMTEVWVGQIVLQDVPFSCRTD